MINIFWLCMTEIMKACLVPCVVLYVCFDFLGMLLFNKR